MLWVSQAVKGVDTGRLLEFLNHGLRHGPGFEQFGKKFRFHCGDHWTYVTRTTVRSLAAALLAAVAGEKKVRFEDLWACAVESKSPKPAAVTLRTFSQALREEWSDILIQCGCDEEDEALKLPRTSAPIPLKVLDTLFDLARVRKVQYKLRHPHLVTRCDGAPRDRIPLDGLDPDTWRVVGSDRSPEPRGKIALGYGQFLSRVSFQIKPGEGGLHVQLLSKTNKLEYQGREESQFLVPHGGEFVFGDVSFRYWEGLDDPDLTTPRYAGRRKTQGGNEF